MGCLEIDSRPTGDDGAAITTNTGVDDISSVPPLECLSVLLAEPDEPVEYRIERLLPTGGRAILAAQFKAGKTTLRDNLVRSLADGIPFLDEFVVSPILGTVGVVDDEMSRGQMRRWLGDQGIDNPGKVRVVSLRGKVRTFNLLDSATRSEWATQLRMHEVEVLIFDCLRPVLDAIGLDEHSAAGQFLVAFDQLLDEAEVSEAIVVHHMGHENDRSRGDSRLRDWPDVEWKITRPKAKPDDDDPGARRYFSAYGRDVDVEKSVIEFDPATRHLSLSGGSPASVAVMEALDCVLKALGNAGEPLSQNKVEATPECSGAGKQVIREALQFGVRSGAIRVEDGPNRARLHSLAGGQQPMPASASVRANTDEIPDTGFIIHG